MLCILLGGCASTDSKTKAVFEFPNSVSDGDNRILIFQSALIIDSNNGTRTTVDDTLPEKITPVEMGEEDCSVIIYEYGEQFVGFYIRSLISETEKESYCLESGEYDQIFDSGIDGYSITVGEEEDKTDQISILCGEYIIEVSILDAIAYPLGEDCILCNSKIVEIGQLAHIISCFSWNDILDVR